MKLPGPTRRPVIITAAQTPYISRQRYRQALAASGQPLDTPWQLLHPLLNEIKLGEVLPAAQEILQHGERIDGVTEGEEGYRLSGPLAVAMRGDYFSDEGLKDLARLTLVADLKRLGYRVAVMVMDPAVYETVNTGFYEQLKAAGLSPADILLMSKDDRQENVITLSFPRDHYVQLGETVYINPDAGIFDWSRLFNWANGQLRHDYSRIGNGGEVIIGDRFAILSEQYIPDMTALGMTGEQRYRMEVGARLFEMTTIGETEHTLQRMGKEVFRIPPGWAELFPPEILEILGTRKKFFVPMDHADWSVLHLPVEDALLVSAGYYQENRHLIDRIVERVKPAIFETLPDEDGRPINSLPLPDGGVFMDAAAQKSIQKLRELGIRVKTTSRPIGTWAWGAQGAIHCATNLIYLPEIIS